MSPQKFCSTCGNHVPGDSVDICPRCILEGVLLDTRSTIGWDESSNEKGPDRPLPEPKQPRYEKGLSISKGGMGEILEARELPVGRQVAMKVIHEAQGGNAEVRARFIEEAQITGQLEHPSIVPMHDLSIDDRGNVFYTMKRVRGQTLGAILVDLKEGDAAALEAYPLSRLLTIFQKICDAVAFAHSRGVIHRDLKPENVMVGGFGEVLVMDWGLAKAVNLPELEITIPNQFTEDEDNFIARTSDGTVKGTIGFMAPEQAEGNNEAIGFPCDIYALGAILYEILTLNRSVQAKSLDDGYDQTIAGEFCSPLEFNKAKRAVHCPGKQIPESLSAVTMRAMAKDPRDRYETVGELQREIEAYQAGFATDAEEAGFWRLLNFFVKRNKVESIAALLIGVIILASSVFLLDAWREAEDATRIAEGRADIITRNLYIAEMNLASEAAATPDGLKRVSELTSNWLPEDGMEDLRGWEWYYFTSLLHRDAATLTGHTDRVACVAYSPDGKTIASAGQDNSIRFWDTATREQKSIIQSQQSISTIAWSPDGTRLASAIGRSGGVKIWYPDREEEPMLLTGHEKEVFSLSWNPEGTRLASGSHDRTAKVWDVASGLEVEQFQGKEELKFPGPPRVNWRPQGDLLAITAGGGPGRFLDIKSGEIIKEIGFHSTPFKWSPDGNRFAMASHQLGVWDAITWKSLARFSDSGGDSALSWSPDGKILTSGKAAVRLWDPDTKKELSILRGHRASIRSVDWNPNGLELATASDDHTVKIWDLRPLLNPTALSGSTEVRSISWSADGLKFAAGEGTRNSKLVIWEAKTEQKIHEIPFPCRISGDPPRCAWSPKGNTIAAVNRENMVKIWNTESYEEVASLEPETGHHRFGNAALINWSPAGDRLAYCWNSTHLSVCSTGNPQGISRIPVGDLRSISWHPDGEFLAMVEGNMIRVLETATWTEVIRNRAPGCTLLSIDWCPEGDRLAIGDNQGNLKIWDPATLKVISTPSSHSGRVEAVSWSPDGSRLASGSNDGTIKILDSSGRQLLTISDEFFGAEDLKWSPDGTRLLGAFRGQCVTVWDATKGYVAEQGRIKMAGALP